MKVLPRFEKYKRQQALKILKHTSPEKFESISVRKLMKAVNRSYRISPAYRDIFRKNNLQLSDIKDLNDFQAKVPVLNKQNFFNTYSFSELLGKNRDKMKLAMSSSGFSGNFAFGFSSEKALKSGRMGVDTTLDYWFNISNKRTFLINCAPMGVHIETSLPLAETSVRSDMALSLLKKIAPQYDQTILVGDPHFLKKLIEDGDEQKIDWKKLQLSMITAQDWLPESLRTYLAARLDMDIDSNDTRGIYATMGMTELGLNVFHESRYTVGLRRTMIKDKKLKNAFIKTHTEAYPCFFHYYPFKTYIENRTNEDHEQFLFSVVDTHSILPIVRYSTGDRGQVMKYTHVRDNLTGKYTHLIPDLKLPIALLFGRTGSKRSVNGNTIYIEDIKEKLYSDFEVASSITGLFTLKTSDDRLLLKIHLKENIQKSKNLDKKIYPIVNDHSPIEIEVQTYNYNEFLNGLELNYEKKLSGS
ncbi:hypothetical protein ES705_11635 [subsurface metagenome]